MGTINSCLPISSKYSKLLCCRGSVSDLKNSNHQRKVRENSIDSNLAQVDELLLCPNVTKRLAESIIKYRDKHDDFKDLDETLDIQTVNSALFRHVCNDINADVHLANPSTSLPEFININFASYDQLCLLDGLTPHLIEQIIEYRKDHGHFHTLEDLLQINGIDSALLETIRPFVTVDHENNQILMNNLSLVDLQSLINQSSRTTKVTLLLISRLLETLPPDLHKVILSSLHARPFTISNDNDNKCSSVMSDRKKKIFRFASWDLQRLTAEKIENPGVREVICRIIIENDLSLIGIQDIRYIESLDLITQELNNPTIPSLQHWPNSRQGKWKFIISEVAAERSEGAEHLGFIYDESVGITVQSAALLPFKEFFSCLPYIATFRIHENHELVFVNNHLKIETLDKKQSPSEKHEVKSLSILAQAMKNTIEKHIVIFGNFNDEPGTPDFEPLRKCNYSNLIQHNTDISFEDPQGTLCLDNIWLSYEAQVLSTGNSGVIRDNLTNFWIPSGWTWGGLVSNHCPVWTEFDLP